MKRKTSEEKAKAQNDKLLAKNKDDYKVDICSYKTGEKIELWRKNKKYGYYNFATYLENTNEDTVNNAIIADVKEQEKIQKTKKSKKSEQTSDDEI